MKGNSKRVGSSVHKQAAVMEELKGIGECTEQSKHFNGASDWKLVRALASFVFENL